MVIFNKGLGKRFSQVLEGVRQAGSGNFNYRIKMKGKDELVQIAGEFNELSERIQKSEEARRQFVADASHELKTPLASIKLLSDSISQNTNIDRETVKEFLGDIGNEIERLIRISEELIAINKADFATLDNYVCNMTDTVLQATDRLKIKAETAEVELCVSCEENCPVFATDDGIFHIVFNLIENAIKYNKKGGKVTVNLKRVEDSIVFTVEDTGIGIPLHEQKRVYERFFRVDKNRSRATGGTGLGLSIVKEWTDKLGGEISLKSTYGKGSYFKVVLPAYDKEAIK
jgi:signal transduction histidine kinase